MLSCLAWPGNPDEPEVWKLNHTLATEGRECWLRDYTSEGGDLSHGGPLADAAHERNAAVGARLWSDQVEAFARYGDALSIAPIDGNRE